MSWVRLLVFFFSEHNREMTNAQYDKKKSLEWKIASKPRYYECLNGQEIMQSRWSSGSEISWGSYLEERFIWSQVVKMVVQTVEMVAWVIRVRVGYFFGSIVTEFTHNTSTPTAYSQLNL